MDPKLIPGLDVTNLKDSLHFYVDIIGFKIEFERPEETFAYLTFEGTHLYLQEADGPGRRFRTVPLERPFGRGVNFQIEVSDVNRIHESVAAAGYELLIPLEERWYRMDDLYGGNRQFVVIDPDGYLLRFFSDLGRFPEPPQTP